MGIKTIGAAMIAGAAGLYILNPGVKSTVNNQINSYVPSVKTIEQTVGIESDPLSKTPPENQIYHGISWPKDRPVLNKDGTYDKEFIRWYGRKNR